MRTSANLRDTVETILMIKKMHWLLPTLLCSTALCAAFPQHHYARPAAFFLAGDSTTAKQIEVNGGGTLNCTFHIIEIDIVLGWGNGFLGTLKNGARGTNYGHNGATTKSFVDGGDW